MKLLIVCLALIHATAFAQSQLGPHEQQGLKDTQNFMKNSKERQQWIDQNAKAKDVDKKVDALSGNKENKEEIYGIASDVLEKIAIETNGDPEAMQRLLTEAQLNPKAFYDKYFSEKDKARVRGVASDIEKKGGKGPSPK